MPSELIKRAISLARSGQTEEARDILKDVIASNPNIEAAWLWLAYVSPTYQDRIDVMERCLHYIPDSDEALRRLDYFRVKQEQSRIRKMQQASDQNVSYRLENARQELLDFGLRNPLINFRMLKSKGVQVVNESPDEVFHVLVTDGRAMSFLSTPDELDQPNPEEQSEADTIEDDIEKMLAQPDEQDRVANNHSQENQLLTKHTSKELQKRLLNTYYSSRTYIEEQGVNVLYIALGMLQWYESENSEIERKAPLLLIPVEIYRTDVRTRFRIRYTEDDIGENLSLRAKLSAEFRIEIPAISDYEDLDVEGYLGEVADAVRAFPRWNVDTGSVVLGFFSFGTFLLYHDLEEELWPETAQPNTHPILRALLTDGFRPTRSPIDDNTLIDDVVQPMDMHLVVDADSSQVTALLDVRVGRNLVIQGPPGTGKSQTITNIIAEAVGQGKTVLFVAEKMAALEVVKRRLDQVGLGDACLELHSHKTKKKAVLGELERTLGLGRPQMAGDKIDIRLLRNHRDRLNNHSAIINTAIGQSGVTPFQAYGHWLRVANRLKNIETPSLDRVKMTEWTKAVFVQHKETVARLQALLAGMGTPIQHPYWGSRKRTFAPGERRQLEMACKAAVEAVDSLEKAAGQLTDHLGLRNIASRDQVSSLIRVATLIQMAPDLQGVQVASPAWLASAGAICDSLDAGERLSGIHSRHDSVVIPEAWKQDVLGIRKAYVAYGTKWWKFMSREFRGAKNDLAGLCQKELPKKVDDQLELVEAILEGQRLSTQLEQHENTLSKLFGPKWLRQESDWDHLRTIAGWLNSIFRDVEDGKVPAESIDYVASGIDNVLLGGMVMEVQEDFEEHAKRLQGLFAEADISESVRADKYSMSRMTFLQQREFLGVWSRNINRLQEIVAFNHLVDELSAVALTPLIQVAATWHLAGEHLVNLFERTWYDQLIEKAFHDHPELAAFDGDTHNRSVEQFCRLDQLAFRVNQLRLAEKHWNKLPQYAAGGQLGILQREFAKKRRHLPIRKLMKQAGNPIQAMKPVFMMSPLSIANYIPPGSVDFDLVLFDEASQVKPVHAFGAILRGRQAVVVGDSRQLPPSSFFDQVVEFDDDWDSATADMESILGLFYAQGAPQRMLNWHYRSRHESLIAVSNFEFYENKLVVFPSPDSQRNDFGLVFHYLPNTVYDRGRSRANSKEAQAVAKAVMQHARTKPEQTLGVASFSTSQMQAIQNELEILRRQDPACERFFSSHPEEPFFVKNLENVQGDERDVVIISVGYGRSADGKVTMNFGPLNKEGGDRRLNVLITRARCRCEVFTNLSADDIDLSRTQAPGVIALQRYLKYAETGQLDIPVPTDRDADSPFEQEVAKALRHKGYRVQHQVGSGGFFIDLAVVDDQRRGRYLLGIECDGATYHSARSARDRDRLRQQVLERLGWRITRIWSTDWFQNPAREIQRVVAAIEKSRKEVSNSGSGLELANKQLTQRVIRTDNRLELKQVQTRDYEQSSFSIRYRGDLHEAPQRKFIEWIVRVVEVEGPVHIDEVARRICRAAGVRRVGNRIRGSIERAALSAVRAERIDKRGDFLWRTGESNARARNRAGMPNSARQIEYVAPEEIMAAAITVVTNSLGMQLEEIPQAVSRRLGFKRTTEDMGKRIGNIVDKLIESGELVIKGGYVVNGK